MQIELLREISSFYYPDKKVMQAIPFGSGHIHKTFKLEFEDSSSIILQQVNREVFRDPELVAQNILNVSNHLKTRAYPNKILSPLSGKAGFLNLDEKGAVWRAFPFINETKSVDKVETPLQAYEAAKAFGNFLKYLSGIEMSSIGETIPDFHNLELRFQDCQDIIAENPFKRKQNAISEIEKVIQWKSESQLDFSELPLRIVHNDTKISNVLLNPKTEKGICVIDLDTVMPGWVVTDFGDMIRTFCCTADENETKLDQVKIDLTIFAAMSKGFLAATKGWLKEIEFKNLINGGQYILLEQSIRFLSDYLKGDVYYPVTYPQQNLDRARNQLKLLQSLLDQRSEMELIIREL